MGKPPEVTFYIHPTVIVEGSSQRKSSRRLEFRLPCRSLRELHERYGPFSAVIMDIEGSELDVLEDSQPALKAYRLVIVEFHSWIIGEDKIERCRQILTNCGLHLVEKAGFTEAWRRGEG